MTLPTGSQNILEGSNIEKNEIESLFGDGYMNLLLLVRDGRTITL